MDKKPDFRIINKEQAFWENEIRLSQMQIDSIRQELINGSTMIEIYENTIIFCKEKLSEIKKFS